MELDIPPAPVDKAGDRYSYPNNLPLELNRFVGRESELDQLRQLVWKTRLLTLTGPGGCGKTRLALKVAEQLLDAFYDGVWFVDLSTLPEHGPVSQAVAAVFALHEPAGRSFTDALGDYLRSRETLLILDNCEHLLPACAELASTLLQSCANLVLLATSREELNIDGEIVWPTPPLSSIRPEPGLDPQALIAAEAPRLFLERAVAAQPAFSATEQNALAIAQICHQLDGLPLAIELAAARVSALSAEQIAERLSNRFDLLNLGRRTAPARHQTLRAMIDWSYGLLSPVEKILFRRLAVFAGGWTLELAEAVCADGRKNIKANGETVPVVNALSRLVEKSLVIAEPARGDMRYRFLETIRQYAREKIADDRQADHKIVLSEEYVRVRDLHLVLFNQWVKQSSPGLAGPDQPACQERFEMEHENIRAALDWGLSIDRLQEQTLELAVNFGHFLQTRNFYSEGRSYLSAALARKQPDILSPGTGLHLRAVGLARLAILAFLQSDFPAVHPVLDESLSILRASGEEHSAEFAEALKAYGDLKMEEGDYDAANDLLNRSLSIFRELNNMLGICDVLMLIGWSVMRAGNYDEARALFEEFLGLARGTGNTGHIAFALSGLGELAIRQGQYERAMPLLEESLALRRSNGDRWSIGTSLGSIGWAALRQGNYPRMRAALKESAAIRLEIGEKGGVAWCLEKLAEGTLLEARKYKSGEQKKQYYHAVCIYGAAAAIREPLGSVIDLADQPEYTQNLTFLRGRIGKTAFSQAWSEGRQMAAENQGVARVLALGLQEDNTQHADAVLLPGQNPQEKPGGLSRREREVAKLIMQGKSNRDIAEALSVEQKTIETHITHIFNKLGFDSRVQIAVWAVEKGLR